MTPSQVNDSNSLNFTIQTCGGIQEKEGREKGRTGTGAVKREGRSGTEGKFRRLSEEQGGGFIKLSIDRTPGRHWDRDDMFTSRFFFARVRFIS